jgi:DNA-binding winged helix-turn-helix (wHTH) protein
LLTVVWGPAHVEDVQYLRVYIGQLRQKLGDAGRLIGTEPGVGYRMAESLAAQPALVAAENAASATNDRQPTTEP